MRRALLAIVVVALVVPEFTRYQGERRLRLIDGTMVAAAARVPEPAPILRRLADEAEATRTHPGDWRPLVTAGRARFLAGDYAQAAQLFERANALGERPEIDVNLGVTLLKLGEPERAEALFARAVKLSPALRPQIETLRRPTRYTATP